MAEPFVEEQTMESGPAASVTIATDTGPAELAARMITYNACRINPGGTVITLGPPSALAMRIRRGDILFTDPGSQVTMGMYATGSTRPPSFASLAGIAAEITDPRYLVRNNSMVVDATGRGVDSDLEKRLLNSAFKRVWRRLRKVGVALADYKANDNSQDLSGVAATLHGRVDIIWNGVGDVSLGDFLCLDFPSWETAGGTQGSPADLATTRDEETRPRLKKFDSEETQRKLRNGSNFGAVLDTNGSGYVGNNPESILRSIREHIESLVRDDKARIEKRRIATGETLAPFYTEIGGIDDYLDGYRNNLKRYEKAPPTFAYRSFLDTAMIMVDATIPDRLPALVTGRDIAPFPTESIVFELEYLSKREALMAGVTHAVASYTRNEFGVSNDAEDSIEWYELPIFKVVRGGSTNDLISVIFLQ